MTKKDLIRYVENEQEHWAKNPQLKGTEQLADEYYNFDNTLIDYENSHDDVFPSDDFQSDDHLDDGEDMVDFLKSWDSPTYHEAVYAGIGKISNMRALYTAYSDTPADVELTDPSELADRCDDVLDSLGE